MIPERLIFLDLETTGSNPQRDRVTEIALCPLVEGEPDPEWTSLVDPETPISPFIEQLTGISSALVAGAPTFAELAMALKDRLEGAVVVAHNARFDHGFLKSEFRRLGIPISFRVLCTVKLSRALYPGTRGHSLDHLIVRHGLEVNQRHRALADARAIRAFFQKMCREHPPDRLETAIRKQLEQPSLPAHLDREAIDSLPAGSGVYLFYGENEVPLYVGKSINLRTRVLSHFSSDHRRHKEMRLSQQIRRIDHQQTAGELGALLLEARLIKELCPVYNRRLRRSRDLFAIRLAGQGADLRAAVVPLKSLDTTENLYGLFSTRRQAEKNLRELIKENELCPRVLGLDSGQGACFGYQIKQCRGACAGEESLMAHELRVHQTLAELRLKRWPFFGAIGIRERSPEREETEVHLFDQWCYLGTATSESEMAEILERDCPQPFDRDSYKILMRYLETTRKPDIVKPGKESQNAARTA